MKMIGKRLLAILLLGLMILSMCACGHGEGKDQEKSTNDALAEEFTFHNGLKFGMSQEEVIAIEKENESELTRDFNKFRFLGDLYGTGGFVGVSSEMWFSFSDDKLVSAVFYISGHFDRDTFESIDKKLTEKYGKGQPIELKFSADGQSALNLYQDDGFQSQYTADYGGYGGNSYAYNLDVELETQRFVPCEGGYVEIQQIDTSFDFYNDMSGYEGTMKFYESIISYRFISEETYQETINNRRQREQEKADAFNNDL